MSDLQGFTNDHNLSYTVVNGSPISLNQSLLPFTTSYRTRNMSMYVQDQWTVGRMTLQGALRFDRNWSLFPEQRIGRPTSCRRRSSSPRPRRGRLQGHLAARWCRGRPVRQRQDVGEGELRQYLEPTSNNNNYTISNPIIRIATTASRSWTDTNNNFSSDCDLRSPAAQSPTTTGSIDTCGAMDNQTFGTRRRPRRPSTHGSQRLERAVNDWQIGAAPAAAPAACIGRVGLLPPWLNNFTVTDNLAVAATDFTPYSITAPSDSRLPGSGGYVVDGLYNVVQGSSGRPAISSRWPTISATSTSATTAS